jgi:hypothetical protein
VPVPEPVPLPVVNVTHDAVVDDVHSHPACVVTVNVPVVPPAGIVTRDGVIENEHDELGSVTTNVWPAIVSVAERALVVVLAAAVKLMLPEPDRPVPLEIVTHAAPLVALQEHPTPVVILTLLVPPPAAIARPIGEIVKAHAAPACVIINELVPIVIVPVRESVPVFAVTE